jgi:uncharacterized protein YjhX (UPF0386 family)
MSSSCTQRPILQWADTMIEINNAMKRKRNVSSSDERYYFYFYE